MEGRERDGGARGGKGKRKERGGTVCERLTIPKRWHSEVEDVLDSADEQSWVQILALPEWT